MRKKELIERRVVYYFTSAMLLAAVACGFRNVYCFFFAFALLPVWYELRKELLEFERDLRNQFMLNRRNRRLLEKMHKWGA